MKIPEISVIVPAYNIEEYIARCLLSLLNQSFKDYEIIIIDDGSTDKTSEIIDYYSVKYERIRVLHTQNAGVSNARNNGLKMAKGKYIVFVDGDDYVDEQYLEVMLGLISQKDADIGIVDYFLQYEDQIEIHSKNNGESVLYKSSEMISNLREIDMYEGYLWNKIFRKNKIDELQLFFDAELKVWEDLLFCYKYMKACKLGVYMHKPLYYYVQRIGSVMHKKENDFPHYKALLRFRDIVSDVDGIFYKRIIDDYASCLIGMLGKRILVCEDIRRSLKTIDNLKASLSFKHKLKLLLFKIIYS